MAKKLSLAMAIVLFLFLGVSTVYATNLLINGDFETGNVDPWGVSDSYSVAASGNGFTPQDGNYFLYQEDGSPGDKIVQEGFITVTTESILKLEGWVATDGVDSGEVWLRADELSLYSTSNSITVSSPDREWSYFSLELVVPDWAKVWEVEIFSRLGSGSGVRPDVHWDSLSLTLVTPIPEPATMLLLGVGLLGLSGISRRRK